MQKIELLGLARKPLSTHLLATATKTFDDRTRQSDGEWSDRTIVGPSNRISGTVGPHCVISTGCDKREEAQEVAMDRRPRMQGGTGACL